MTLFTIFCALFPRTAGKKDGSPIAPADSDLISTTRILVSKDEVRFYLADLNRGVNPDGWLALHIKGCFAVAAPFLLFRLKREGFSECRVTLMVDDMLLTSLR